MEDELRYSPKCGGLNPFFTGLYFGDISAIALAQLRALWLIKTKMDIKFLQADKGDCILLSWTNGTIISQVIIDGGISGTYRYIRPELVKNPKLDAVFITHVDYDHIGGIFKVIDDKNSPIKNKYPVFVNTPELILHPLDTDKVGVSHGIEFDKLLKDKNIEKKGAVVGLYKNNEIYINGLKLTILSPTKEILTKFCAKWTANELYKQHLIESITDDKVATKTFEYPSYEDIINSNEQTHKWEDDLINSSSVAFIAEHNNCKILLLGDANPDIVANELEMLGYNETNNKIKVELLKISHHGSRHNTTKRLLNLIDSKDIVISTNGAGPYFHPHRETIIKIAEYCRVKKEDKLIINTNYDLQKYRFIKDNEEKDWNIEIKKKLHFTY